MNFSFRNKRHYEDESFETNLMMFVIAVPVFAEWIWTHYNRKDLLQIIKTPKKRFNKLLKINFDEISDYINMIRRQNDELHSTTLDQLYLEYRLIHLTLLGENEWRRLWHIMDDIHDEKKKLRQQL